METEGFCQQDLEKRFVDLVMYRGFALDNAGEITVWNYLVKHEP